VLDLSNSDKLSTPTEKNVPDRKFPMFHLKINGTNIEVTLGPSLAGIVILLATAKLTFVTTTLALVCGGGAVLRRQYAVTLTHLMG